MKETMGKQNEPLPPTHQLLVNIQRRWYCFYILNWHESSGNQRLVHKYCLITLNLWRQYFDKKYPELVNIKMDNVLLGDCKIVKLFVFTNHWHLHICPFISLFTKSLNGKTFNSWNNKERLRTVLCSKKK